METRSLNLGAPGRPGSFPQEVSVEGAASPAYKGKLYLARTSPFILLSLGCRAGSPQEMSVICACFSPTAGAYCTLLAALRVNTQHYAHYLQHFEQSWTILATLLVSILHTIHSSSCHHSAFCTLFATVRTITHLHTICSSAYHYSVFCTLSAALRTILGTIGNTPVTHFMHFLQQLVPPLNMLRTI